MQVPKAKPTQDQQNQEKNSDTFFLFGLIGSWLIVGLITTLFGFFNLLNVPLLGLLVFPLYFLGFELKAIAKEAAAPATLPLLFFIVVILLIHATGVFTPETGFDAVWYHLPVLAHFKEMGAISYKASLYQTANPLLSDLLFFPAFQLFGSFGTKVTAFVLGLSLVVVVYRLSRHVLSVYWSLWVLITLLVMQPIAWQMSSFYVDIAKAFWEVSLLILFLKKSDSKHALYFVGILLGASIATKAFSILLLPMILVMLLLLQRKERLPQLFLFVMGLITIVSPFYLYTWSATGSPFMSVGIHLFKLQEIGGSSSLSAYVGQKVLRLPLSWWYVLVARDYISVLIPLLLPLLVGMSNKLYFKRKKTFLLLSCFALLQWLIWWFVPPLSTRYALSGFIVLSILLFWAVQELLRSKREFQLPIITAVVVITLWHLLPRLLVLHRTSSFLLGSETKQTYLRQFHDGSIDTHLDNWYKKN